MINPRPVFYRPLRAHFFTVTADDCTAAARVLVSLCKSSPEGGHQFESALLVGGDGFKEDLRVDSSVLGAVVDARTDCCEYSCHSQNSPNGRLSRAVWWNDADMAVQGTGHREAAGLSLGRSMISVSKCPERLLRAALKV